MKLSAAGPMTPTTRRPGLTEVPMYRVLVVDDEEIYLRATAALLRSAGLHAESAVGGENALERLSSESFDVVLVDLMMPRMNGIELVRRIHANHPDVHVVLTSAFPLSASQIDRLGVGHVGFVGKPSPLPDLVAALVNGHVAAVQPAPFQHTLGSTEGLAPAGEVRSNAPHRR